MDIRDPYQVLGVSPGDSDEDIARAYRKLAKKYHPDLNPGNKAAEEKMKEINAAYDIIKNKGGSQYSGYESPGHSAGQHSGYGNTYEQEGPFGWFFWDLFGGQYQQRSSGYSRLEQAATLINNGQYTQALSVLAQINEHDAQWYYMSAIANAGLGNRVTALSHAKTAAGMEPSNYEYQELVRRFEKGSYNYRQAGKSHGFGMQGVGRTVWQMLMAQLACMFCCRPC